MGNNRAKALLLVADDVGENRIREFQLLSEAGGYEVLDTIIQRRRPDTRYYLGIGKLGEVESLVRSLGPDVVITYHQLNPIQYVNLERRLKVRVMDRILLILEIFERRAGSKEAKLQIELTRLRLEIPRVREFIRLAKMGEQIGFYGGGEYAIEAYYRYMMRRVAHIRRELSAIKKRREMLVIKRRDYGLPQVALTGYTSAGKTTLFNRLARESKYVDGKPFATLDTYSRLVNFNGLNAILTDTIGFIDDLPPLLIESFYATIAEVLNADLVLFMMDISDDYREFSRKFMSSLKIFNDLGISRTKILPVLNKVDLMDGIDINDKIGLVESEFGNYVLISAKTGVGIDDLRDAVRSRLEPLVVNKRYGNSKNFNPIG
ncbi:GTPase HflX [Vulcanisaeta distributa]|uniref:GTPase HflX n=1 Tax=Vulcanisaeta distributa (strain DSM 14429 / JCM 11212 / NBRC 100878 / IC-017) TaxID=572478 RepID=E1QRR7_VULDI|nr:GTPase HflX [Vulcanisaeta distributa]ADN49442.1 GTP-binding proten HflX [Vulcanisaeta distributa DSM 14429]